MARFKYTGEKPRPGLVKNYGDCTEIRVRCSLAEDPSGWKTLLPNPAGKFPPGQDIGHDITDPIMLRMMRADTTRFEEV